MADFVSVLRRAVGNLENNTEAARQAIYGKARAALRAQLEAIDPPLGPDDISRQIDSLDQAVGELEAEFAAGEIPPASPVPPASAVPSPTETAQPPSLYATDQAPRPHESFQSAVSESGALGGAASTAARQARETLDRIDSAEGDYAAEAPPSAERKEPSLGAPTPSGAPAGAPAPGAVPGETRQAPPPPPPPARPRTAPAAGAPTNPTVKSGANRPAAPADLPAGIYDEEDDGGRGGSGRIVAWVILFLVLAGIAGVGFWQRGALMETIASLTSSDETADSGKIGDRLPGTEEETAAPAPEVAEQPVTPTPAEPPPSAEAEGERVAQALLIEESPGGVAPSNTLGGSVDWRLVDDTEAIGGVEKIIRGDVEVPERDLKLTLTIRRNTDQALPASHLIELVFQTGPGFEHGGIASIPGILMKATPRSTGQPLVGAVVPVMDNYFLIGLSESDIDRERNVQEIIERDFMDIPVGYKDGGRAVLSVAKGESGKRAFDEAFAAWDQQ